MHPTPPGILKWTPYVAIAWLVIGVVALLWLRAKRPDSVARIGSILGFTKAADTRSVAGGFPRVLMRLNLR